MEAEVWKIIPDYGKYEASNLGKIRVAKTKQIMKQQENKGTGYYRLGLMTDDSKRKTELVHRMIAETFLPNINNDPTVDHINNKRDDNRVCNLRWASMLVQNQPENRLPRTKHNLSGARSVNRIDLETGEILQTYESASNASRWVIVQGLSKSNSPRTGINEVCRGKKKTAFGFGWSYVQVEIIENEIWKPLSSIIDGTEGYFVSNKGRFQNNKGRISSGYNTNDVIRVSISSKKYTLRRLVATAFIENPNDLPHVINVDKNIENNCIENLRWVSGRDAQPHSIQSNITHSPDVG